MTNFSTDLALNLERSSRSCGRGREESRQLFLESSSVIERTSTSAKLRRGTISTKLQMIRVRFVYLMVEVGGEIGLQNKIVIRAVRWACRIRLSSTRRFPTLARYKDLCDL